MEKVVKNERWLTLKRKKITKINTKGKNTIVITKRNHTYVKSEPISEQKARENKDTRNIELVKESKNIESNKKHTNEAVIKKSNDEIKNAVENDIVKNNGKINS